MAGVMQHRTETPHHHVCGFTASNKHTAWEMQDQDVLELNRPLLVPSYPGTDSS